MRRVTEPVQAGEWKAPKKCERPGCAVVFTPYRKDHKYCSPKCKKVVVAYRFALSGGR